MCDVLIRDKLSSVRFIVLIPFLILELRFDRMGDGRVVVFFCEETQDHSECFGLLDAKTGGILTGCSPIPRPQKQKW